MHLLYFSSNLLKNSHKKQLLLITVYRRIGACLSTICILQNKYLPAPAAAAAAAFAWPYGPQSFRIRFIAIHTYIQICYTEYM